MREKETENNSTPILVENKERRLLDRASKKQQQLIIGIAITLGISAIAATLLYFGVRKTKKIISNIEENKAFGKDKYATWAKQFKIAFLNKGYNLGTLEEIVRKTMLEIPSQEDFEKVAKSYARMFEGEILAKTLESELSHTEYAEMKAIKDAKPKRAKDAQKGTPIFDPDGWAIRLNAGVSYEFWGIGWGTDWEAIKQVIKEMKNAGAKRSFEATELAYMEKFGVALRADLKGDLDWQQQLWVAQTLSQ